jgi:hypothetical protein
MTTLIEKKAEIESRIAEIESQIWDYESGNDDDLNNYWYSVYIDKLNKLYAELEATNS